MTVTLDQPTATPSPSGGATLSLLPVSHPHVARSVTRWDDQEQVHRAVMALFPTNLGGDPATRRAAARILYRHESPIGGAPRLLIQHQAPLRASHDSDPSIRHADLEPFLARLDIDMTIRFRVTLNAVRSQTATGKRLAITGIGELATWGRQRLTGAGLGAVELTDNPAGALHRRGTTPLWTVRYDGHATITDPAALRQAVITGIGRGKAYGCGLLSVTAG